MRAAQELTLAALRACIQAPGATITAHRLTMVHTLLDEALVSGLACGQLVVSDAQRRCAHVCIMSASEAIL